MSSDQKGFVKFEKIDIGDRESVTQSFQSFKPNKVVNLAAQAGVRYSLENPYFFRVPLTRGGGQQVGTPLIVFQELSCIYA